MAARLLQQSTIIKSSKSNLISIVLCRSMEVPMRNRWSGSTTSNKINNFFINKSEAKKVLEVLIFEGPRLETTMNISNTSRQLLRGKLFSSQRKDRSLGSRDKGYLQNLEIARKSSYHKRCSPELTI